MEHHCQVLAPIHWCPGERVRSKEREETADFGQQAFVKESKLNCCTSPLPTNLPLQNVPSFFQSIVGPEAQMKRNRMHGSWWSEFCENEMRTTRDGGWMDTKDEGGEMEQSHNFYKFTFHISTFFCGFVGLWKCGKSVPKTFSPLHKSTKFWPLVQKI